MAGGMRKKWAGLAIIMHDYVIQGLCLHVFVQYILRYVLPTIRI